MHVHSTSGRNQHACKLRWHNHSCRVVTLPCSLRNWHMSRNSICPLGASSLSRISSHRFWRTSAAPERTNSANLRLYSGVQAPRSVRNGLVVSRWPLELPATDEIASSALTLSILSTWPLYAGGQRTCSGCAWHQAHHVRLLEGWRML
jgi:hypothetical protein